ncbi:hypothetical protein GRAN_4391 [Granulicella sibirica]|uniref:DUF2199 domain-containing protein n=1 Tax=Granulicella sibirica TaxID=2479048 RepID=A0A4Q0SWU8_9BACT|nr:hypothetical protein GRAN_4391 [Granulicella sibirica]
MKAPAAMLAIPDTDWNERVMMTPDQCVIDGNTFYLRGRIPVPVIGLEEPFIWGVWAEVGPKDFLRANELWNTPGRESEAPFRGYLDTNVFLFGNTMNLEVWVQTQIVGHRPHFAIANEQHPLAIEQRDGITMERVVEIAEMVLHAGEPEA